jgi:hypothetical protein
VAERGAAIAAALIDHVLPERFESGDRVLVSLLHGLGRHCVAIVEANVVAWRRCGVNDIDSEVAFGFELGELGELGLGHLGHGLSPMVARMGERAVVECDHRDREEEGERGHAAICHWPSRRM